MNRQDFENPLQKFYNIEIGIQGDANEAKRVRLSIEVINIFDNAPTITLVDSGPCVVDELLANVDTKCAFNVYHPDGTYKNPFELTVEGRYLEERKFGFSEPYNVTDYSRNYNLM